MNEELLKIEYHYSQPIFLETLVKNFLLCDLITAFATIPKYWMSLTRYLTLKSSSFMFCQHLIETLCVLVVICIS